MRIQSRIQTNLEEAIEDEDVEIAYPHQHHVFDETSGSLAVSRGGQAGPRRTPEGARVEKGPQEDGGETPAGEHHDGDGSQGSAVTTSQSSSVRK